MGNVRHRPSAGKNRNIKLIYMLTILLILAGLLCFALFFKSIDFFDKI